MPVDLNSELSLNRSEQNKYLSVIIRCHREDRLDFLDEALFSLATQYWQDVEIVIVIQNGSSAFLNRIKNLLKKHPFPKSFRFQVNSVSIAPGVDGRSTLLNHGIRSAQGRYLAFLDDDDIVYHHGYSTLIGQLMEGVHPVAVGGCRIAELKEVGGNWHVQTKRKPYVWGRSRLDLFKDNFIPIHSYVIDRFRVDESYLCFDDNLALLEDYDFLLKISAHYEFDFSKIDVFVCEYRMHGGNTLPSDEDAYRLVRERHIVAQRLIEDRKQEVRIDLPIAELLNIISETEKRTRLEAARIVEMPSEALPTQACEAIIQTANPQIIRKVFDRTADKVYGFFSRYPGVERKLSRTIHFGWRLLGRRDFRQSPEI